MTPDTDPQTPRPKDSSSSLLAAFKSLTGSKPRNPSSTSAPFSPSATPPISQISNPLDLPDGHAAVEPLDGHVKSSLQSASALRHDALKRQTAPSGPPGLRSILGDLQPEKTLSQRVSAAKAITKLLAGYFGADVAAIWTTGQHLLELDSHKEALVAGYELLNACVCHKDLDPVETKLFFQSISSERHPLVLDLRLKVLRSLTQNGRNIADIGAGFMSFLVRLLKHAVDLAKGSRKNKKKGQPPTKEERDVEQVYDYILDVLKYNSKAFDDVDLDLLVSTTRKLAYTTYSLADLEKTIDIMDCLITYSCLPQISLDDCVDLMCGTFNNVPALKDIAWRTVVHLLSSHLGPSTINTLLSLLKNAKQHKTSGIIKGACQLMTSILKSTDVDHPSPTTMPKLVSACRQALDCDSKSLHIDVMRLILQLCIDEDAVAIVFNDKIWTNIESIVTDCANRSTPKTPSQANHLHFPQDRASPAGSGKESLDIESHTVDLTRRVAQALVALTDELHSEQKLQVMRLLMRIAPHLDDVLAEMLVDYYREDCLLYTFQSDWRGDCHALMQSIFKDYARSSKVRKHALQALRDAHDTGAALNSADVESLLLDILQSISAEPELAVVDDLCQIAITAGTDTSDQGRFVTIVECLKTALHDGVASSQAPMAPFKFATFAQRMGFEADKAYDSLSTSIAKALVKIFLRTMNISSWKAKILYDEMLTIARLSHFPAEARIIVLKLLFRLRAETNHNIFIVSSTECEGIAALLCRTADTLNEQHKTQDSPVMRPTKSEDQFARRSNPSAAMKSAIARNTPANSRSSPTAMRVTRPTPPLWLYPGPKGLPEEPPPVATHVLSSKREDPSREGQENEERTVLRIGAWLELLLEILQQDELEWEVYSYSLVHLGAQLTNHALFAEAIPQVQMLRSVICNQLANKNFHEPPTFTGLKRSDAAICLYHVLTMLLSYREHFSRNEEDEMVKMFIAGIGSWERTSEICIHALSICCHELPASLTKVLENTLQRVAQIITQSQFAVHILEFLAALARLPELFKNFREEEFKIVFGICLRYLQDARESKAKGNDRFSLRDSNSQSRPASMAKDSGIGSRPASLAGSAIADDLPQYVYALAYHVMTFWFMALKLQDRSKHVGWISEKLSFVDHTGCEIMEEQGQVTIDMMQRVAFSDRDETTPNPYFAKEQDGVRATKSWVVGKSIVTIETAGRTGFSQIIRRRPTGTTYSTFRPTIVKPPRHQAPITIGSAAESYYTDDYVGILPEHVFQEFYAFQDYLAAPFSIELPEEDAITRAISTFDRISPLDGHKVGIIYVGENQKSEAEILSNVMGSADYTAFLSRIGSLIALRDAPLNTQGLDRSETEMDGKFTFAWRDRVTELVFHVATMMPNHEHDKDRTFKKRHIGNDFVNIIFNNSGSSWDMNTIPSDFNSINIVVAPEARVSFVETRETVSASSGSVEAELETSRSATPNPEAAKTPTDPYAALYYKVTVLTKPGIPAMSPAHITKIVSGASLPAFVRLLALNASSFAQVWANRESAGGSGEHPSSWRSRLKEIVKLRERYGPQENMPEPPRSSAGISNQPSGSTNSMPPPQKTNSIQSLSSSLAARDSVVFRRQSKPNIFGNIGAEAVDMERSSSAGSSTRN